jgi:heat shock protein HslJ
MKKLSLILLLMLVASIALVACNVASPEVFESEETPTDGSAETVEMSEEPVSDAEGETPAEPAPEEQESTQAGGRVVTAWVGPELVDCVGVAPQQCMQVKTSPDEEYSLFYDQIEGFEFQEGYEYELQVLVEPVPNPPADGSALKYTLVEIVSQTPVTVEQPAIGQLPVEEDLTFEGPTWLLESYLNLEGQTTERLPETRVTITFADGQVNGSAGCNNYFGPYEVDANNLTIGPLGSTLMACDPNEVALQETAYLASLSNVASYEIVAGQLQLRDADGQTILIYTVDEKTSLTGTLWTVTGYNNGRGGVTSVILDSTMNALFIEKGLVAGSAGCNDYRAAFEADDANINISPAAATRKMCAELEGIMEQEAQYLAALEMAATYEIDGSRMDMYDESGARVVTFKAEASVEAMLEEAAETVDMPVVAADESSAETAEPDAAAAASEAGELAGTSWQWVNMVTPIETVSVDDPGSYVVEFMPDGLIAVQADCNSGSGSYEASGGSLSINITSTTLALCGEESLSDLFIRSLNASAIYFDQNGNLFIDLFADAGTMEFAPN